ncbi:hypothetical protein [Leptolyngbya sp. 7M]|uniref:hypothetical protein n=1 Tax=Leptolyngbya sp. 7M TaxID=2812896 RepID=UPI001B8B02B5|nr:hypothetical protein [Leptolyngbya sp. 7M]QYO67194.1 hypothetical protein JVX88_10555 [Leptolyngbya sp. 7M]
MVLTRSVAAVFILLFLYASALATSDLEQLAAGATSPDRERAEAAISELRAKGQAGLDVLFAKYSQQIAEFSRSGETTEEWLRVSGALDKVAMQKDAYASGLYWFTDLVAAQKLAAATDRPVLSLRLLGNLNEEFSCANSRLFRALLYADPKLSGFLKNNYVLHWSSVRPAPRITIDFGDGRKIERTVTGNSIHYILDEDGRIIDGLPGIYSPAAFLIYLEQGKQVNDAIDGYSADRKSLAIRRYRGLSFDRIRERRENAIKQQDIKLTEPETGTEAFRAAPIAVAKMFVTDEITLLRRYDDFARFEPLLQFSDWKKLAAAYSPNIRLSNESLEFIRRQVRGTGRTTAEFSSMLARLKEYIALDTTRNDVVYHLKIYEWLNYEATSPDVDRFNQRVYADLFKTPNSDPWLGLYSTDVYAALDGNGITR